MDPTHRERQDTYRFWHPQLNITFCGRLEYRIVQRALRETGQTPRQILIQWARQIDLEVEPDSTSNPTELAPDLQEDSPGSTDHPNDMVTQSTDKGGNSLTL